MKSHKKSSKAEKKTLNPKGDSHLTDITTQLSRLRLDVTHLCDRLKIGTGNDQGVWMDRSYVAMLEKKVELLQKNGGGDTPLAHSVELSKRMDQFVREIESRLGKHDKAIDGLAIDIENLRQDIGGRIDGFLFDCSHRLEKLETAGRKRK